MAGKGDRPREVDPKKYAKGMQSAYGHWDCKKCYCTWNSRSDKKCRLCGAKR